MAFSLFLQKQYVCHRYSIKNEQRVLNSVHRRALLSSLSFSAPSHRAPSIFAQISSITLSSPPFLQSFAHRHSRPARAQGRIWRGHPGRGATGLNILPSSKNVRLLQRGDAPLSTGAHNGHMCSLSH